MSKDIHLKYCPRTKHSKDMKLKRPTRRCPFIHRPPAESPHGYMLICCCPSAQRYSKENKLNFYFTDTFICIFSSEFWEVIEPMRNKARHDMNPLLGKLKRDRDTYKTLLMSEAKKLVEILQGTRKGDPALKRDQANSAQGAYEALNDIVKWCEQFKIGGV